MTIIKRFFFLHIHRITVLSLWFVFQEFSPGSTGRMTTMGAYVRDLLLGQVSCNTFMAQFWIDGLNDHFICCIFSRCLLLLLMLMFYFLFFNQMLSLFRNQVYVLLPNTFLLRLGCVFKFFERKVEFIS